MTADENSCSHAEEMKIEDNTSIELSPERTAEIVDMAAEGVVEQFAKVKKDIAQQISTMSEFLRTLEDSLIDIDKYLSGK